MSEDLGKIVWHDLTVPDAEKVRAFYSAVVGWRSDPVDMGGYSDYMMVGTNEEPGGGICWARGENADLPPQWLLYVMIENLDASLDKCRALGGTVLAGPRALGKGQRFAVVRDPAGAVMAIVEKTE